MIRTSTKCMQQSHRENRGGYSKNVVVGEAKEIEAACVVDNFVDGLGVTVRSCSYRWKLL